MEPIGPSSGKVIDMLGLFQFLMGSHTLINATHLNLLTDLTQWQMSTLFTRFTPGLFHAFRYQCGGTENYCSTDNGLSRADVLGCQFFCNENSNGDGEISEEETDNGIVLRCTGGDPG